MRFRFLILLLAATLLSGCRPRAQTTRQPVPEPTPPSVSSPGGILQLPGGTLAAPQPQVGIVDLSAVARVHPRWRTLETLAREIEALQIQLASPPPPPPLPRFDFEAILREEAERLRTLLQGEIAAMRAQSQRELDEYVTELTKSYEARLLERQKALEEELKRDIEARQRAVQAEMLAFEDQVLEEYRLPLFNIRLRLQAVQFTSREESERLVKEYERLQAERAARIKTREQEAEAALAEYQKKRQADATEALKAAQSAATAEVRRLAEIKQQDLEKSIEEAVKTREATFRTQLDARRRQLVKQAEARLAAHQEQYAKFVQSREKQLQVELTARRAERARLEASIMAEVRIEVAALAQEKGLDTVIARQYLTMEGVDITEEVAHKVRRQQ